MASRQLHVRRLGPADSDACPVVFLHGLFGVWSNWQRIARPFAADRAVLLPDLRNHGRSPWDDEMSYESMAGDLLSMLDDRGIEQVDLVGHSMGGKAAMWLALTAPTRVRRLIVADTAPISYPRKLDAMMAALRKLPLGEIRDRKDADARLAKDVRTAGVRDYLLTNLVREQSGWRWRMNLKALCTSIGTLQAFPEASGRRFEEASLFIYGTRSDYVGASALTPIRSLFPLAELHPLAQAGHWVYSEQPEAFTRACELFLS